MLYRRSQGKKANLKNRFFWAYIFYFQSSIAGQICSFFIFFDCLSFEVICGATGTLDSPSRNRVKSCFLPLNPFQTGLFEGFLTIVRQLKDIAVKGGFFKDHK